MNESQLIDDWNIRLTNEWYYLHDRNHLRGNGHNEDFLFRHWVIEKLAMFAVMIPEELQEVSSDRVDELLDKLTTSN